MINTKLERDDSEYSFDSIMTVVEEEAKEHLLDDDT